MGSTPLNEEQLREMLAHLEQEPGHDCVACHRPIPKKKADDQPGRATRSIVSISEPPGEEGTLEGLMISVVDKYKDVWPREYAAMRQGIGVEVVGGLRWKYYVTQFALYALLMVEGLAPTAEEVNG